jgi:uncharacterized protein YjbJ (UPF0337 family)
MGIVKDGAKNEAKGIKNEAKGKINEVMGAATGDFKREVKGAGQKHEGKALQQIGRAQEKLVK